MTTIASPSVQASVGQIVARILDRARLPAEPVADAANASAGDARASGGGPAPAAQRHPARFAAIRPALGATPRGSAAGAAPAPGTDISGNKTPGNNNPGNNSLGNNNLGNNVGNDVDGAAGPATPASSTSVILSALLSLANRALPMDITPNPMPNTATLQGPLTQLPAALLAKPQVIEAVVLRNTLLPSAPNGQQQPATPLLTALGDAALASSTRYQVSMQWQGRVLQFVSPQPLPRGTSVQLQVTQRGEVLLLSQLPPGATPARGSAAALQMPAGSTSAAATSQAGALATMGRTASQAAPQAAALASTALNTVATQQPNLAKSPPLPPQQTLQQSLREVLPRQQALHTLVPLLQKLVAPRAGSAQLPAPIVKQLVQLLKSLPRPEQLQTGAGVKRALENSGSFLEARIVRSSASATPAAPTPETVGKVLETDLKAQMTALLEAVRKLLPAGAAVPQGDDADVEAALADELVYNPKQLRNNPAAPQRDEGIDAGDLQLAQLSKLLQSGLARIQLNQLDGAVSRHNNADPQLLTPAWVLELPLANSRGHSDNLELRIEQQHQQQTQKRVQWNVQISFDLHELGKIAATLAIVDKNVAATVWAERAHTHASVRDKLDYLRVGLESVGVRVTEMQCRHGLPPARSALISQQLVDVHT